MRAHPVEELDRTGQQRRKSDPLSVEASDHRCELEAGLARDPSPADHMAKARVGVGVEVRRDDGGQVLADVPGCLQRPARWQKDLQHC